MNQKAIEIQVYFEIAMAIGNNLDLHKMLQQALSAYLRKLGCTSGMILQCQRQDDRYSFKQCFSIPRNSSTNPIYTSIIGQLPDSFSNKELLDFHNSLPLSGVVNSHFHFHVLNLPEFGLLLLVRKNQPLDSNILNSLRQLNLKLARSCNACLQKERIDKMNEQLNQEIQQRLIAENSLNDLLANLETQIKDRTQALENSRQRYKVLFDHIQDIYFSLSLDGIITEISPSVEPFLQHSRKSLLNRSIEFIGISNRDKVRFMQKLNREKHISNYLIQIPARDKAMHYFSMNASLVNTFGKGELHIVGSLRDITQQHIAEESRKTLEEKLLNSKKMEALGLLAGGVAHDLNNVLSGIVSYPDLLLSKLDEKSDLRQPIATIRDSGEKAAAIVQDLLTMARRNVVQKEIINLNPIVIEYLESPEFDKLIHTHPGLYVKPELAHDLLNMQGSSFHIKKALMNLVHNGAEAEADTIIIKTENRYIEKTSKDNLPLEEGDYIVLKITDNGHGIPDDDRKRVFEPFYTKKVMGRSGTGLGMPVVWGTVEDHKGHISIDSQPDEKTVITLFLPASRQQVSAIELSEPIEEYHAKGETILIVDDSEDQRQIASAILKSMGFTVRSAASGEEALAKLHKTTPDLILLDMIMGTGLDGLDTYREIRKINPASRVIIATGYSETDRVKEALRLGVFSYIRKPYLIKTLGKSIRSCLDGALNET